MNFEGHKHSVGNYLLKQCMDIIEDDIHPLTLCQMTVNFMVLTTPTGKKI